MKKQLNALTTILLTLVIPGAIAGPPDMADLYFSDKNPTLTTQEKQAITIAEKWKATNPTGMTPTSGPNGTITFLYGAQQPSIVCAVLQVCDVSLQAGEQVNGISLGDAVRWSVEPSIEGSGLTEVQHLIIKTLDVGLETSLVVTTNRRAYNLQLRSHRTQYMPKIAFSYPEDAMAKWEAIKHRETTERQEKTIPQTGEYLGDLNFEYEIEPNGPIAWTPVRVYHDKQKTIIQMPEAMLQTEAPSLLVVRREGGWFEDDETVMVNYRIDRTNQRYIVDTVFDKAILIAGVGSNQDTVTIQRVKK